MKRNIFLGLNCRGRAPLNQRSFERCSKKFGHCSKICAMFKNSQKRHCPPPWSVRMSACQRRQGCSTSPFGQRTFATRPPSKAEDMGLSQGSFVSFLEERVKEVFTSIHVSVESTKPAEVYTTDTAES